MATFTPEQRAKKLEQIRALLRWTTDNGCTTAEAEEAARKVTQLMSEYQISEEELKAKEAKTGGKDRMDSKSTEFKRMDVKFKYGKHGPVGRLLMKIAAKMTQTFVAHDKSHAIFYGLAVDVEIAAFIFAQLQERASKDAQTYMKEETRKGKTFNRDTVYQSYCLGWAEGLSTQISEVQRKVERETSTALVVLGNRYKAAVDFARTQSSFGKTRSKHVAVDSTAKSTGFATGYKTQINKGLKGGG